MRILVLGAGTVGTSIAEMLCHHRHSVTVVDACLENTRRLNEELDLLAITGSASQSSVLFQAGVLDTDLCLAVTGSDEVNLVAASMAKSMGARRAIARVYAPVFRDLSTFDYQAHFNIDRLLSIEHLSAMEFAKSLRSPGAVSTENYARGEIEVQEVEISKKSKATGQMLKDLELPKGVRLGSISRESRMWIAGADDVIEMGDRVTLIGSHEDVDGVKDALNIAAPQKLSVVIAGGGETGLHLARTLEGMRFSVTLMEEDLERCEYLAAMLKHSTVVHADATRRASLEEERVGSSDAFVACTGDDENNILACVEAREIGASKAMSIVGRPDYANVVGKLGIDLAVSPREVVAREILGFLNTGAVISRTPLGAGGISVFEIEVVDGVPATEHVLANLHLPTQCLIAAVTRGELVKVPGADDRLKPGDTVVVLIADEAVDESLAMFGGNGK
jgi:trk system potassium uptake protein TrkA